VIAPAVGLGVGEGVGEGVGGVVGLGFGVGKVVGIPPVQATRRVMTNRPAAPIWRRAAPVEVLELGMARQTT
jgi:hypothetical protein